MPKSLMATVGEYLKAILFALILALLIRFFVVQAFKIPSGSMMDTLLIGDHLLVSKFAYDVKIPLAGTAIDLSDPERGDIIVFLYGQDVPRLTDEPGRWLECNLPFQGYADESCPKDFIKRIIGLPGDIVEVRNKDILVNGRELYEPYVQHSDPHRIIKPRDSFGPIKVPEDKYFVLGDNRDESLDSRFWGFVDRERIRGKAWRIYWSWESDHGPRLNRIGKLLE
ncbi:signal peptidase I [Desulfonatronum thiosulfatophilum]|uniref:Signal peptidase I n=1 Tax=Desulfonatronum thiosulfatophilum TaxID=617002 RepID=A0A1G6AXW3_9BACT|nr:signal peptidase I [Desulfonatronum thiosulfatophilum]SDB13208.1 signal peptidase I [Desulfonatronum thiosulfatophilum]